MKTTLRIEIDHEAALPPDLFYLLEYYPGVFADEEIWRAHPGLANYEVSSLGKVRRVPGMVTKGDGVSMYVRGGELRQGRMEIGYTNWSPCTSGKNKTRYVHRSVAETFYGQRGADMVVRHLNGVRNDNRLLNLAWGTRQENEADKIRHGTSQRGEAHGQSKLTEKQVLAIRRDTRSGTQIAADYGITANHVNRIRKGQVWRHLEEKQEMWEAADGKPA